MQNFSKFFVYCNATFEFGSVSGSSNHFCNVSFDVSGHIFSATVFTVVDTLENFFQLVGCCVFCIVFTPLDLEVFAASIYITVAFFQSCKHLLVGIAVSEIEAAQSDCLFNGV